MLIMIVATEPRGETLATTSSDIAGWLLLIIITWTISLLTGHQTQARIRAINDYSTMVKDQRLVLAQQLHDTVARSNARIVLSADETLASDLPQEVSGSSQK